MEYVTNSGISRLPPEVTEVLERTKPHKAPGPDGLTLIYYSKFLPHLTGPFLMTANSVLDGKAMPKDSLRATISVLYKEGKDPLRCESYRPIALLILIRY